ncbi:UNVERIFIED_CONTAM: hypothetical protein Sradi_5260100 [Sesamum radiatum]|uniref:Uncharacterized protein n=1 Tax=Sesamum radiatum TaxID=300843 RepID=A0AAW2LP81_SESRA
MNIWDEQNPGSFGTPPPPLLIQITLESLCQLVEDAYTQATNKLWLSISQNMLPPSPQTPSTSS